jgi:predicted ester cyclase
MAKTALEIVNNMVDALNNHVIEGQEAFWSEDMVWRGPAGIGTLYGLKGFQDGQQRPFIHAFPDKNAIDEVRFGCGNYAASTGVVEATHLGDWLGIPASGKPVKVRYMDIWRSEGDKLVENWVLIDLIDFMEQIGLDPLEIIREKLREDKADG